MTKDHILPRSKGGLGIMDNLQIMCEPCNTAKGNTYTTQKEGLKDANK